MTKRQRRSRARQILRNALASDGWRCHRKEGGYYVFSRNGLRIRVGFSDRELQMNERKDCLIDLLASRITAAQRAAGGEGEVVAA